MIATRRIRFALAAAAAAASLSAPPRAGAQSENPNPMDSIRRLPGYRPAHDTVTLLATARIDALPPGPRAAWRAYVARSRARYTLDTLARNRELKAAGLARMTRGPYGAGFERQPPHAESWFGTDSARRVADNVLSFQTPNGGWSKRVDMVTRARRPGENYDGETDAWEWISTIDNDATTTQLRFLARVDSARRDVAYETAFRRGVDWLLAAQMPNGCWPQIWPLEGSYHDAATFNDDAIVNAMTLLGEVRDGRYGFVPAAQRHAAGRAADRGLDCVLASQVVVNGKRTVWGQQHDPLTLAPTSARSYELTSLTALESAQIVDYLMSIPSPGPRVVAAVNDAIAWFRRTPLRGYRYEHYQLTPDSAAGPLWGRLYDTGSGRIIMSDRDGITRHSLDQLTDRRTGYGWYTTAPAATLERFEAWSRQHPR